MWEELTASYYLTVFKNAANETIADNSLTQKLNMQLGTVLCRTQKQ